MPFPTRLLNEGEEVVLDLHPHWWYLSRPVALAVVLLVATVASLVIPWAGPVQVGLLVLLVVCVLWLVGRYTRWRSTSFVLTNHRVIHRAGVVAKTGREIPLDHINDISYYQGIFDRMIGAGDLRIESAGEHGGQEVFPDMPRPGRIQNEMYGQIEAAKNRMADRMAGRRELSIPEQIEKLDELRRRGVLSEAEFEASKADLLNRL
jgi:uncharacterized membrane protein YdbT with pleckstrin-like domain